MQWLFEVFKTRNESIHRGKVYNIMAALDSSRSGYDP